MLDNKRFRAVAGLGVVVAAAVTIAASVNLHGNIINADTGFQVGGAAPYGFMLIGNGSEFVPTLPATPCPTTQTQQTSNRSSGVVYHNASGCTLTVQGAMTIADGGATGGLACLDGPTSPPQYTIYNNEVTSTVVGTPAGFTCASIPPSWYYEVTTGGAVSPVPLQWFETTHQ